MMFTPKNTDNLDNFEKRHIRIAFANINVVEINEMFERLKDFSIS